MFNKLLLQKCADILVRRQQTLSVAESVTAGLLQTAFASAENATVFFQGGLTAYNVKQKYAHLHVDLSHAISCNSVSDSVAREMAMGVTRSFTSDWGIATTGYAAPLAGHHMDPLHAYYAITLNNEVVKSGRILHKVDDPFKIQLAYVDDVIQNFLDHLITIEADP